MSQAIAEEDTNLFARLDANGDWRISREEFAVEWHKAPASLFAAEDANEDGFVEWEEFEGPKGQHGPKGTQDLFSRLDADRDGERVSSARLHVCRVACLRFAAVCVCVCVCCVAVLSVLCALAVGGLFSFSGQFVELSLRPRIVREY